MSLRMSASTPMVARATSQRRMNHRVASATPTATATEPTTHRPRGSWFRTGPSITALVINGTATVAARLSMATTIIAIQRAR